MKIKKYTIHEKLYYFTPTLVDFWCNLVRIKKCSFFHPFECFKRFLAFKQRPQNSEIWKNLNAKTIKFSQFL